MFARSPNCKADVRVYGIMDDVPLDNARLVRRAREVEENEALHAMHWVSEHREAEGRDPPRRPRRGTSTPSGRPASQPPPPVSQSDGALAPMVPQGSPASVR